MKIAAFSTVVCLFFFSTTVFADTTFVKFGATWKYFDAGTAAPADWRSVSFNDAGWKSGPAEFGYGARRERTTIHFGSNPENKYTTTYFRKAINLPDISQYSTVRLNCYIDDGAVIYVNGVEVARMNIKGNPNSSTLAAYAEDNGNTLSVFDIAASSFVNGPNIIAVEVHQSSLNSSDLAFDLEMVLRARASGTAGMMEPDIIRGPYLQMVSGNGITIKWTTSFANSSRVKYGSNENTLGSTVIDRKNTTEHEIRISGLKPDTKYFYAIGSRSSVLKGSYRNYFTTAPPADTKRKIRIGVFGDPGTGTALQKSSRDNYLKLKAGYNNAEMVIMLGDNAYNAGTETEHTLNFFNIYNNNIFDNHVIFPVPGNHEYANDQGRAADHNIPYYKIFTVPAHAESGGLASGTPHYYSYNYGNIHFVMLDSYGIDAGSHLYDDTTSGPQAVWLKADLAANAGKHKWTIVCLHHPPYTNGSHISDAENDLIGIRRKITPILERFGVDVVLAGHSHVYERSYLIREHIGFSDAFNKGSVPGGVAVSLSSARYDGSAPNRHASADSGISTSTCPYFTIDSVFKHGTVYVVAGSAGQINANNRNTYPLFYTRNQALSNGGESGALYLEIQDNRLDAKFVGNSGTVRDQFTIMKGVNKNNFINVAINKPVVLSASWVGGYNWNSSQNQALPGAAGNARNITITPKAAGQFTYYVNDSLAPSNTCITDTFTLQVTSSVAASVIKYDVLRQHDKVLVQWATRNTIDADYFTIERSADGEDFNMIMEISGNTAGVNSGNYEFTDNHPLNGTGYYRLMATDKKQFRHIIGTRKITCSPNPATDAENAVTGKIE
jgi:hypothetical protein